MMRRFLVLALVAGLPMAAFAQSQITVGSKVIYPGGADQPPKEKDTGVTFKVGNIHGSVSSGDSGETLIGSQASMENLLQTGQADALLAALGDRLDPLSRTYRALALIDLGRETEAQSEIERALLLKHFPEDLRSRLEEALPDLPQAGQPTAPDEVEARSGGSPPAP